MEKQHNGQVAQRQRYGIGIFEDEILLSDFTDGDEKRFLVTPEQLMSFFRADVTLKPFPGLVWMKSDGLADKYLLTIPAGERTILFKQKKKVLQCKLRLPKMVALAHIEAKKRSVEHLSIAAYSGGEFTNNSNLYELPLPNISGVHVCLGETKLLGGRDVCQVVERTMFDTPFNHHGNVVGKSKVGFLEYHDKYGGRCPLRTLRPVGNGYKFAGGQL